MKSITTPNSPIGSQRGSVIKQIKHSEKSIGSIGEYPMFEEIKLDNVNVAIQNKNTNHQQKIVLPKGIINFNGPQSRAESPSSKSVESKHRRIASSHEPREESLRRKKKVMQIIRNFQNDPKDMVLAVPEVPKVNLNINNQGVDPTELSVMLKSKLIKANEVAEGTNMIKGLDQKGKIIIHNRITKTFAPNTPERSCEKIA